MIGDADNGFALKGRGESSRDVVRNTINRLEELNYGAQNVVKGSPTA
jgi:hypothetical protein